MQDPGKHQGITRLSHSIKLLDRILVGRIRKRIEQEMGEEQLGLRTSGGTTDRMFALRQLIEKRLEMKDRMAVGFVKHSHKRNGDDNSEMGVSVRNKSRSENKRKSCEWI